MTPEIYILLPVHNRKHLTREFVDCLGRQTFRNYHLVMIDDGSSDGTEEMVLQRMPDAVVLKGGGRLWWAGSLQKGIDWLGENGIADSAIILFINDDVSIGHDYLANAVAHFGSRSGVLLLSKFSCGDVQDTQETGVIADMRRLTFKVAGPGEAANCLSTKGLFIRFGDVKKVGNFHPRLLPHYLSDYEYTIRAHRKGMFLETIDSVYLCPNVGTTGHHNFANLGFAQFMGKYFSIKSAANPIYWTTFVLLASPRLWLLQNLARVWYRAASAMTKQLGVSRNDQERRLQREK
jgi:GT2 family glycosyltransferase